MTLPENERSRKLQKLLDQKQKIEARKQKIEEQIRIEEDRIRAKSGKMTGVKKKQFRRMRQAYEMRQEGETFIKIGQRLDISASQASKLCQMYSVLMELLNKQNST